MSDQTFGSVVRAMRKNAGLTQRRLAELCGVDFTYISKIETDGCVPSHELAKRICVECNESEFALMRSPLTTRVLLSDLATVYEVAISSSRLLIPPDVIDRIEAAMGWKKITLHLEDA